MKNKGLTLFLVIILVVVAMTLSASGVYYYQKTEQHKLTQEKKNLQKEAELKEQKITKLEKEKSELQKEVQENEKKIAELEKKKGASKKPQEEKPVTSSKGNIIVDTPSPGATVKSPVKISGKASVFEAQFSARVKDASGKVIGETSVKADIGAPEWGNFETALTYGTPAKTQTGTIEVFDRSEKDGSIEDIARIKVVLKGK